MDSTQSNFVDIHNTVSSWV